MKALEERKKALEELRSLKKPVPMQGIKEHQLKYK